MAETKEARLGVSGPQAIGSALAAVTSAVLLSTLGVAGTLIGAAAGSLIFTFGGVLYTRSVEAGRRHAQQAAATARGFVRQARIAERASSADSYVDSEAKIAIAGQALDEAEEVLKQVDDTAAGQGWWRQTLRGLPWKRIFFMSVGLFIVVMVAITAFELAAGRTVSSLTGGSGSDGTSTTISFRRDSTPDEDGRKNDDSNPTDSNQPAPGESTEAPAPDPTPTEQPPVEESPAPTPEAPAPVPAVPEPTPEVPQPT